MHKNERHEWSAQLLKYLATVGFSNPTVRAVPLSVSRVRVPEVSIDKLATFPACIKLLTMANPNRSGSLTAELLSSHKIKYSSATNHTFLAKAGNGSLPDAAVCKWLVQDKYYQLGYVNFIGGLLAKQDLSPCVFSSRSSEPQIKGKTLSRMTLDLLVDSVTAIRQEIDFYDETAKKYKLDLQYAPPNDTTNEYIKLFTDASAKDAPLLHGLLVLWATEHVCDAVP